MTGPEFTVYRKSYREFGFSKLRPQLSRAPCTNRTMCGEAAFPTGHRRSRVQSKDQPSLRTWEGRAAKAISPDKVPWLGWSGRQQGPFVSHGELVAKPGHSASSGTRLGGEVSGGDRHTHSASLATSRDFQGRPLRVRSCRYLPQSRT